MNQDAGLGNCVKLFSVLYLLVVLSGCASVDFENLIARTNQDAAGFTHGNLQLIQTVEEREKLEQVAGEILKKTVSQDDAVRLAMVNSPALQAMLAQNWADAARVAQTGRIVNPVFTFERLVSANELEIGRLLTVALLDMLTYPQRYQIARNQIELAQLQLTGSVIDQVTQVRFAWVRAVAAQQGLVYARQVHDAAYAGAELARRLQSVGNINKLQRARQQAFYADAATQLATAQHIATATREELIRILGLTDAQAQLLKLPERLPDLPDVPRSPDDVGKAASNGRLDIKIARAELEAFTKAKGLNLLSSFTDVELGLRYDTIFDNAEHSSNTRRGFEVSVRLPLFDWGELRRNGMNAQVLAAAYRFEAVMRSAGSNLREAYSAYRTAHDIARHYRDEVLPLRKTISEENLLRYNGMLISVFELLADSRDQVGSVIAAIAAEQQFWLAEAALQASLMGKPAVIRVDAPSAGGRGSDSAEH